MPKPTPVSEQRRLVARWRQTDQSKSAFARSVGVHPNTFWSWTRRHLAEPPNEDTASSFIEVTPCAATVALTVLVGPPGQRPCEVGFGTLPPADWFASVLREVAS